MTVKQFSMPDGWRRAETENGEIVSVYKSGQRLVTLPLTLEERDDLSKETTKLCEQGWALALEKKDEMAKFKLRQDMIDAELRSKISILNKGEAARLLDGEEFYDHQKGIKYFKSYGLNHDEMVMKETDYLIGTQSLFGEIDASNNDNVASLVATTDGKKTKINKRGAALAAAPFETDSEIQRVMREETSVRGKVDHVR